jgi:DEAD/DEAH box helicase domain-containing protein
MNALQPGLKRLIDAGAEPPEVGIDLADEKGKVMGDCELAWVKAKVVVLRADQDDLEAAYAETGWRVMVLADDMVSVHAKAWESVAADALGLAMNDAVNGTEGGAL